jgi:hypothetical protein
MLNLAHPWGLYMQRSNVNNEIEKAIHDQITFIKNSCFLYDKGCQQEALRIAGALNVLFEKRKRSLVLLRVFPKNFKLLSTVPDAEEVDPERLVTLQIQSAITLRSELEKYMETFRNHNKFSLIRVAESNKWYVYGFTQAGREIICLVNELPAQLDMKNMQTLIDFWISKYSDSNNNIADVGKKNIIRIISVLFGYENKYVSGFHFPMIKTILGKDYPQLTHGNGKYLFLDEWLDEIIYSISDRDHDDHVLTRRCLINSGRDQDGGGHFDIELDKKAYCKSKYGEKLAEINGKEIITKNYHLMMLILHNGTPFLSKKLRKAICK